MSLPAKVEYLIIGAGVHGLSHLVNSGRVGLLSGKPDLDPLVGSAVDFMLRPGAAVGK